MAFGEGTSVRARVCMGIMCRMGIINFKTAVQSYVIYRGTINNDDDKRGDNG